MRYFSSIRQFFYSEEITNSRDQIKKDFGNVFPSPLDCSSVGGEFNVVRTRGIGSLYFLLVTIKNVLRASKVDIESLPKEFKEIFSAIVQDVKNSFNEVVRQHKKLFYTRKTIFFATTFLMAVLSFLLIPIFILRIATVVIKINHDMNNILGLFIPPFENKWQVAIRVDANKYNRNVDSIVSHEHIHLLQHKKFGSRCKGIKHPEIIISQEYINDKRLRYLLERNEVEARLHEIVISYYREIGQLPLTVGGFFELLAGSNEIGCLIYGTLRTNDVIIRDDIARYEEREVMFAEDVATILSKIKLDFMYRFITEVMTVMYGNLLSYYGDDKSSINFLQQIKRNDLYHALYS